MRAPAERGSVFRMASFRLAVLGTMLSTIGAIIVFAMIYGATARAARQEFSPIVAGDRADLIADALSSGSSLRSEIELATLQERHTFYALTDTNGVERAGNIPMPSNPLLWRHLTRWNLPGMPPGVRAIDGIGQRLSDGDILFIGEDASVFARLNTEIAWVFAGVFGFMISLGLVMSLLIALYSLQRVRAISEASRQIVAGDLSHRIKLYGIDDELDFLTTDLNLMLATIDRLVETARQVTSDIAHDLRAPLTRLRDHLVQAQRRTVTDPGYAQALQQVEQIIAIFAALLRIAEVEAGAVQGHFEQVDLSTLCRALAESYEPVAEDRGQRLTHAIADDLIIQGDTALITQMMVNLIENAIRHCPPGIAITLAAHAQDRVLTIELADRGPGIRDADRERVFRRFVRLDAARTTAGHGLGLALVNAVVGLHGGTIALLDHAPGLIVRITLKLTA
ncbi:ATP-binding protein [Acidiphilium sp. PA]|uniref:sensor histidine kinase n=1 Tax=Acidiphilium sp. PA TaxID=2871705 RepID=UPI0022448223|nr:HAMP domain-containing sensor histidine kinase [Acidiphilium sp. PA]MCW8307075.1 ATP-binding protein [Acidiphilium sp. PA]